MMRRYRASRRSSENPPKKMRLAEIEIVAIFGRPKMRLKILGSSYVVGKINEALPNAGYSKRLTCLRV